MIRLVAAALAVLLWAGSAQAYTALGAGSGRCDVWNRAQKERKAVALDEWLLGVVTGYNIGHDATLGKGLRDRELVDWVSRYCAEHPAEGMPQAATKLIEDLRQRQH